jgi:hypothetical protein
VKGFRGYVGSSEEQLVGIICTQGCNRLESSRVSWLARNDRIEFKLN